MVSDVANAAAAAAAFFLEIFLLAETLIDGVDITFTEGGTKFQFNYYPRLIVWLLEFKN
jgi:archaellum biogenesis protein FlaJ (TadC family)